MRVATVHDGTDVRCGVVVDDRLLRFPAGTDVLDLIRSGTLHAAGEEALSAGDSVPVAGLRLLPPLDAPTVRDFVAFEEHVEGMSASGGHGVAPEWFEAPTFYFTNPYALIGSGADVPMPPGCDLLDFELEVAAVIGTAGGDLTAEQARGHIVGYTVFNDWSARDLQFREMKVHLGPCKGKDFASTVGPVLVTADELEPYRDGEGFLQLAMSVEVNGREIGRDLLSNMGWPFEDLVAYASRGAQVRPGDVLGSGTCGNGGCLAELWGRRGTQDPPPLVPGDIVTMTVEGIGTISNTVVKGQDAAPVRPAWNRPRTRPARDVASTTAHREPT